MPKTPNATVDDLDAAKTELKALIAKVAKAGAEAQEKLPAGHACAETMWTT